MTIVESPLSGHLKYLQSVLATDLKHLEFTTSTSSLPSTHLVMKQQNISCLVRVGHSVKANALGAPPHQLFFQYLPTNGQQRITSRTTVLTYLRQPKYQRSVMIEDHHQTQHCSPVHRHFRRLEDWCNPHRVHLLSR